MTLPTHDFDYLWNDLPLSERKRLMPYMAELQILHIWQAQQVAIQDHKRHMRRLNQRMDSLKKLLQEYANAEPSQEIKESP